MKYYLKGVILSVARWCSQMEVPMFCGFVTVSTGEASVSDPVFSVTGVIFLLGWNIQLHIT